MVRAAALALPVVAVACSLLFPIPDDAATGLGDAAPESSTFDGSVEGAGAADAGGDAPSIVCPDTGAGPTLLPAGAFCIDRTEVTAAQYDVFLRADAAGLALPASCAPDAGFDPVLAAPSTDFPVLTTWCSANAYCQWAGKRLCGALDGGALNVTSFDLSVLTDRTKNEWVWACEDGDRVLTYPYGNDRVPSACAPDQAGTPGEATSYRGIGPVGAHPACVGGYPGILDLVGNADEWVNVFIDLGTVVDGAVVSRPEYYARGEYECRRTAGPLFAQDVHHGYGVRCCWSP